MNNLYEKELELEQESRALGIKRYREIRERTDESSTKPGLKMLSRILEPTSQAIEAWYNAAKSGKQARNANLYQFVAQLKDKHGNIEFDTLAYYTAKVAINAASAHGTATNAALLLTGMIEDELLHREFQDEMPGLYHVIQKNLDESNTVSARHRHITMQKAKKKFSEQPAREKWGTSARTRLGWTLIQLCAEASGIVEIKKRTNGARNTPQYVEPTDEFLEWLQDGHNQCALLAPVYQPMVVQPLDWTNPHDGGYLDKAAIHTVKLVKTRSGSYLDDLDNHDMQPVYDAVNALQRTPWQVNRAVLSVMDEVWSSGGHLGGLPTADEIPLPPKPTDIDTNEEAKRCWKFEAKQVYGENIRLRSKRVAMTRKLYTAREFADYDEIYFVWSLDWRGRAYPVTSFLHPQADDSGKALLRFAEGKPLGESGAYWLAVHLANSFGYDKVSLDERVQWVYDNEELILDAALEPLDGKRWWCEADKPWLFLAACFEWLGFRLQGPDFISHLPISVDGSCNGLQNFSAMLRDHVGGAAVNLTPNDKPSDIYTEVAERVVEKLKVSDHEMAPFWAERIDRGMTKRPVMTLPYGSTRYGMADQIAEECGKRGLDLPEGKSAEACVFLAGVVYETIGEVVIAAREAMDWLQDVARLVSSMDLPIRWRTPVGFPVVQAYQQTKTINIDSRILNQRVRIKVRDTLPGVAKRKQASGIAPNFVHSLDASHMMLTVLKAQEEFGLNAFAMVHDSFGVHACDVDALSYSLREAFVEMYSQPVLDEFREEIREQLSDDLVEKLPELPACGNLDIEAVRDSEFFFA